MKFLANLFAGRVALWRSIWLIGLPLSVCFAVVYGVLLWGFEAARCASGLAEAA